MRCSQCSLRQVQWLEVIEMKQMSRGCCTYSRVPAAGIVRLQCQDPRSVSTWRVVQVPAGAAPLFEATRTSVWTSSKLWDLLGAEPPQHFSSRGLREGRPGRHHAVIAEDTWLPPSRSSLCSPFQEASLDSHRTGQKQPETLGFLLVSQLRIIFPTNGW